MIQYKIMTFLLVMMSGFIGAFYFTIPEIGAIALIALIALSMNLYMWANFQ
jgi:hypothetical protein